MSINLILAIVASCISIGSYIPYIRDIRAGKTKPHIFSWIVWTLMTVIYLFAQISGGAGIGALTTGVTVVGCSYIIISTFKLSDKQIKQIDWLSFAISIAALLFWIFTNSPTLAVILITISDFAAFIPTIRKSFSHPQSETLSTWMLAVLKHSLVILSLERITFVTSFYTIYLIIANTFFIMMVMIRRKQTLDNLN